MGNGLGIKETDLHGLSGPEFRSEIILANITKNTAVNHFRTIATQKLRFRGSSGQNAQLYSRNSLT
jgi:hypothetical protein